MAVGASAMEDAAAGGEDDLLREFMETSAPEGAFGQLFTPGLKSGVWSFYIYLQAAAA